MKNTSNKKLAGGIFLVLALVLLALSTNPAMILPEGAAGPAGYILMAAGILFLILGGALLLKKSSRFAGVQKASPLTEEEVRAYKEKAVSLVASLGGFANIDSVESCLSRIRVRVQDIDLVEAERVQALGAQGMFVSGNQIQAIFGPGSEPLREQMEAVLQQG